MSADKNISWKNGGRRMFRKVPATDATYVMLKEKYQDIYNDFRDFAQYLTDPTGKSLKISGKSGSYARYWIKLLVIIEEQYGNDVNELVSRKGIAQLQGLENHRDFNTYNKGEGGFPRATIRCFEAYVAYKFNKQTEASIDIGFNTKLNEIKESESDYISNELVKGPRPRKEKEKSSDGTSYPRNIAESVEAKRRSNWSCEIDNSHVTFMAASDNMPYVEAHHLIPMAAQDFYQNTIDFADNIVALCPNCHRKIHHAKKEEKRKVLRILFNKHKEMYLNYGIEINFKNLCTYYN